MKSSCLFASNKIIACLLTVTLLASSTMGYAAVSKVTKIPATPSVSHITMQAAQVRALVAIALADVANLRAQVNHNKNDHVLDHLLQLNTLVSLVKASRSTGEIDALIKFYQQHLSFEDNKQVLVDILPLYRALSDLPKTKKTVLARQQLDKVRTSLEKGMQENAVTALEDMRRSLSIDGVDFPLLAAEEKVRSITNLYEENQQPPKDSSLLGLETDLLQILNTLS